MRPTEKLAIPLGSRKNITCAVENPMSGTDVQFVRDNSIIIPYYSSNITSNCNNSLIQCLNLTLPIPGKLDWDGNNITCRYMKLRTNKTLALFGGVIISVENPQPPPTTTYAATPPTPTASRQTSTAPLTIHVPYLAVILLLLLVIVILVIALVCKTNRCNWKDADEEVRGSGRLLWKQ